MKRKFEEYINEVITKSKDREMLKGGNIYIWSDFEDNYIWNYFVNYIFKDLNLKKLVIKRGSYYLVYDGRDTKKVSLQDFDLGTQKVFKLYSSYEKNIADIISSDFEIPFFCFWKSTREMKKFFQKKNKRLHKKWWKKLILIGKLLFRRCIIKRK